MHGMSRRSCTLLNDYFSPFHGTVEISHNSFTILLDPEMTQQAYTAGAMTMGMDPAHGVRDCVMTLT